MPAPINLRIRRGTEADLPRVHELIVELAVYERAPDEVTNTLADMRRDGFGLNPIFGFFVAETDEQGILGIALFYTGYSTWKGRMLYLEDLIVTEQARGTGIGRKLFDAVVAEARRTSANRLRWQVLEWNEPAIGFYKKIGANLDPEWHNGTLTVEELRAYRCDPAVEAAVTLG
ncbi:GNAT family N-acetyltransferase [Solirubrum puertoriconensis]|uniref:GNAT family acetyltransferase n=1 Tax=Solirubrum puertoriconensis TaxID=1751427 RepID=A0A9X0L356_SOLP1|nr:GNAT family N-acetyltransferase [Solirubrum puertoriconensis]KUG06188.1 GNAT family acetyltransferase [Solirubrum puertoriconensis]